MEKNKTKKLAEIVAAGFYTGYSSVAPGTVGTLVVGIPLFLILYRLPVSVYGALCVGLFGVGCKVSDIMEEESGKEDPSEVVIDEIVGYLVAAIGFTANIYSIAISFLAFRFFDIFKPWPVRDVETQLNKGLGIMADDVVAGLYANILTRLIIELFLR